MTTIEIDEIARAAAACGLRVLGGLHPEGGDQPWDDQLGATLVLLGNVGHGDFWRAVTATADMGGDDPLDDWSRSTIGAMAARFGARALFPFDGPPYRPFQRWAVGTGGFHPSPIGLLVHPDFGTWHALRGALSFPDRLDLPPPDRRPSPCAACPERPCLSACPVGAFTTANGYDVPACLSHLRATPGGPCMSGGCLARHACPAGASAAYPAAQAAHHMSRFVKAFARQ